MAMPSRAFPASLALSMLAATAPGQEPSDWFAAELPALEQLYRHLHQNPELSFREVQTAARLAEELERAGCAVTRGVGGLGVVGVLHNGAGPVGLLRADMDALPIAEETGLPWASRIRAESEDGRAIGIMHACGHDVHMASLVGTVRWLHAHRQAWRGTLVCIGQPAEERAGGARAMLGAGLLERFPRPAWGIALHCSADLPTGTVGVRAGYAMANVDSVDITMFGRGGHGASPHLAIDPIVQAAQLVLDLQTIVTREIDPIEPAVITVGSIRGGSKHNIIDDSCHLQVTVRSYAPKVREQIRAAIVRKAEAVAASHRADPPKVEFSEPLAALHNDPDLTAKVTVALRKALGADRVVEVPPIMGAEDFAEFGRAGVPICMFRLGTIAPERLARLQREGGVPPLHSARYHPDAAESLRAGIRATTAIVLDLMPPE
jgi:amidohydrolase